MPGTLLLWVAAGGALGAVGRYLVGSAALRLLGPHFPWGTLAVNVAGSFAMVLAAGYLVRHMGEAAGPRAFVMVGVLGGFTTFSAFSLDAIVLMERGQTVSAAMYVATSVVASILALMGGLHIVRHFVGAAT